MKNGDGRVRVRTSCAAAWWCTAFAILCTLSTVRAGFGGWTVSEPGQLHERSPDFLHVTYESADLETAELRPPEPVLLPAGTTRLKVWYAQMRGDTAVAFVVRDARGENHVVGARTSRLEGGAVGGEGARRDEWPVWNRAESFFLRAPDEDQVVKRMLPEYREETLAEIWPRPLFLVAIRITPVPYGSRWGGLYNARERNDVQSGRGEVMLTGVGQYTRTGLEADWYAMLPGRLRWSRDEDQVLFADDVFSGRGPVRFRVAVRRGYQGPVVWQQTVGTRVDRRKPRVLFENRLHLPRLPAGRYFVHAKVWGSEGELLKQETLQWFIGNSTVERSPARTPALRWETGYRDHVFPPSTRTAALALQVAPSLWRAWPQQTVCRVSIIDWRRNTVATETFQRNEDVRLHCPVSAGNDYFATAEFRAGETIHDRARLHFGVANGAAEETELTVGEAVPSRDEWLVDQARLHPEYRVSTVADTSYPWVNNLDLEDFEQWSRQAARIGADTVAYKAGWGDTELLPGVFRWDILDEQTAVSRKHGQHVILGYTPYSGGAFQVPIWLDYVPMRDQYGHFSPKFMPPSHWDSDVCEARNRFWSQLTKHFLNDTAVAGYRIHVRPLQGTLRPEPYRTDYSEPAQEAFQVWRRNQGREPIPLPPVFHVPGKLPRHLGPDLSRAWRDFVRFNTYTIRSRITELFDTVRTTDPVRQIHVDRKNQPYAIETVIPALRDGGALKNEAAPVFRDIMLRSMCVQAGVPYLEELHRHMPTSRSIADATNFWCSHLSDTIFWLLRWRPDELQDSRHPLRRPLPDMMTYLERTQPHWQEFIRVPYVEPEVLVFGSRAEGLLRGWRRGYYSDIGGRHTFAALFKNHHVQAHFANEHTDWVDLASFNVVFACGEVMARKGIERLEKFASNGGRLVLVGDVARYCPERPRERNLLAPLAKRYKNVRRIASPERLAFDGVRDWAAMYGFDSDVIDNVLAWSGATRLVRVETARQPGFQVLMRREADGMSVYLALMRGWPGWYRGNIEQEKDLREKFGLAGGRVAVKGLRGGTWRVERFHRTEKDLGSIRTEKGILRFEVEPALAGEVRLFRLTRLK